MILFSKELLFDSSLSVNKNLQQQRVACLKGEELLYFSYGG